ncbi:MAG: hypothetical protein NUV47_01850 [Patescibacteria group bacterium]|nr:hypothetical protein [Patescibacteria group bacterium]
MSKPIAEQSNSLSIFWLKKYGYLDKDCSYKCGGITWTYGYSKNKNSISFSVIKDGCDTSEERAYINLRYTNTNKYSGGKDDIDYKIELTTTPCRYGGKRYWFICPLYKNEIYCGRRVGVIFSIGKWFGCRHCGNIAYSKQMVGGKYRWNGISILDLEKAEKEIKRYYYKGKPTRKYKRLMRLNEKFEQNYGMMLINWENRLDNIKKK